MNGAASGLIEALATVQSGTDWDQVPYGATSWWKYGGGGAGGSGSLCGVPNGCCAVLNMVNLSEFYSYVMKYYSYTAFPTDNVWDLYEAGGLTVGDKVKIPLAPEQVLARTVSLSPLCHVSISKWCDAAGVTLADFFDANGDGILNPVPEEAVYKFDRCAKVCADMAAYTAGLINFRVENPPYYNTAGVLVTPMPPEIPLPADTQGCIDCHNGTADSVLPAQQGNMDCAHCHTNDAVIVRNNHGKPGGGPR